MLSKCAMVVPGLEIGVTTIVTGLASMKEWVEARGFGVSVLTWWEVLIKPGIKKLAIERGKELSRERSSLLNLLMMRQSFLTRKVHAGHLPQ